MTRTALPDRRRNVTEKVQHLLTNGETRNLLVTFGFDRHGRVREMFCADFKEGTDLHGLIGDGCMAVSLLLQHGHNIEDIVRKMQPEPKSILRTLAEAAARVETEDRERK